MSSEEEEVNFKIFNEDFKFNINKKDKNEIDYIYGKLISDEKFIISNYYELCEILLRLKENEKIIYYIYDNIEDILITYFEIDNIQKIHKKTDISRNMITMLRTIFNMKKNKMRYDVLPPFYALDEFCQYIINKNEYKDIYNGIYELLNIYFRNYYSKVYDINYICSNCKDGKKYLINIDEQKNFYDKFNDFITKFIYYFNNNDNIQKYICFIILRYIICNIIKNYCFNTYYTHQKQFYLFIQNLNHLINKYNLNINIYFVKINETNKNCLFAPIKKDECHELNRGVFIYNNDIIISNNYLSSMNIDMNGIRFDDLQSYKTSQNLFYEENILSQKQKQKEKEKQKEIQQQFLLAQKLLQEQQIKSPTQQQTLSHTQQQIQLQPIHKKRKIHQSQYQTGGNNYKEKYLEYKLKYLNLKNKNNI